MKIKALLGLVIALTLLVSGCTAIDPYPEAMYTKDIHVLYPYKLYANTLRLGVIDYTSANISGVGGVASVSGTLPITSTAGANPVIGLNHDATLQVVGGVLGVVPGAGEIDPVYLASVAHSIQAANITDWNNKISANQTITLGGDLSGSGTTAITGGLIGWAAGHVTYVPLTGDIQTYVNSATAGDTLLLASGVYTITANITVNKQLNIVGQGSAGFATTPVTPSHGTLISSTTASVTGFQITSDNVRLATLSINLTGAGSTGIYVAKNHTGIVLRTIDIIVNDGGVTNGAYIYSSNVIFRDVTFYITSSNSVAAGVYIYNDSTASSNTTVDCFNVTGTVQGGATSAYDFACFNNNTPKTITLNLSNSVCKALSGTPQDFAIIANSTTTNNAIINAYMCTFDGADYDAYILGTNQLNLGGSNLVNNRIYGAVTYRATLASGNGVFGGTLTVGSGSITDTTHTINFGTTNITTTGNIVGGNLAISNWNTAYTNSHTHSNKSILDTILSANITSWNNKVSTESDPIVKAINGIVKSNGSTIGTATATDVKTTLGYTPADNATRAQASGLATLNASSKVVQDPANAQTTPASGKIPLANGGGRIAQGWLGSGNTTTNFLRGDQTWATPSGSVAWGAITGTLTNQTDLRTALNNKAASTGNTTITTLGAIGTGTWNADVILGQYGGTGKANTGKTITLGGSLVTTGGFTTNITSTGTTNVVLPTSGTLATLAGSEAFTNKSYNGLTLTATTGTLTIPAKTIKFDDAFRTQGANSLVLLTTGSTNVTLPTTGTLVSSTVTSLPSLAGVGTITSGSWNGTTIKGQFGGTGIANTGKTITLGGNLATSGAYATTLTMTGATSVTLPINGVLLSDNSTNTVTNKTFNSGTTWNGNLITGTYGGTGVNNGTRTITLSNGNITLAPPVAGATLTLGGSLTTSGAYNTTLTVTGATSVTLPLNGIILSHNSTATLTNKTWNSNLITGQYGGTGVANTNKLITLGGNLTTSGAFNTTLTMTALTSVTLPTSGTLFSSTNEVPNANIPVGINNGTASANQTQLTVAGTYYYITNSTLTMPATAIAGMKVGTRMTWHIAMSKDAAGTTTFRIVIYRGTNGSTADTKDVIWAGLTQTAVVDNMIVDVQITVVSTGATGSYFWSICPQNKAATITGFGVATGSAYASGTVSGVAMNTASLKFGIGFMSQTGTPTIKIPMVEAQAYNMD